MDTSSGTLQSPSTFSESSKTGSSKSGLALDTEKDRDFTKDNAASPIDLECHIQEERITKILNEAIYKVKLSICLPKLVAENKSLRSTLTPQHFDDVIFIFEQYDNPLFSTSLENMGAAEDIKAGDISLKNRLNPELGHLLCILNSYPALKPTVESIFTEMRNKYVSDVSQHTRLDLEFLIVLERFRELMIRQMVSTAADELSAKILTRKVEDSNLKLIEKIKECTDLLKTEMDYFEETIKIKSQLTAKLEQEVLFLYHDSNTKLNKKLLDSNRQMVLASRSHAIKGELLKDEDMETHENYENTLRRHLMEEKAQRLRRFKVETQLMSWLQKYDYEMAEKQIELDDFIEKYNEEKTKCEELEEKLEEQDIEFIPLMAEREEEYHQEMTDKMNEFLIEHSARVLQVAWKEVLANRAEKKKLKKLQKKLIAEAEAAALRAEKQAAKEKREARKAAAEEKKAAAEAKKEAAAEAKRAAAEAKKNKASEGA